jgi:hypothetical protein
MTLKKREKIFAAIVGGLLVVAAVYWLWPSTEDLLGDVRDKIAALDSVRADQAKSAAVPDLDELLRNLQQKKDDAQKQAAILKRDLDRLPDLRSRALPASPDIAKREYQNWLGKLASNDLKNHKLEAREPQPLKYTDVSDKKSHVIYEKLHFTITSQSTIDELTRFLFDFYSAGHLHKICSVKITPLVNKPSQLELTIQVEALSLPDSKQTDKLSSEKGNRLKLASVDAYKDKIVKREPFLAYAPPRRRDDDKGPPQQPTKIDPLQYTFLTAILEADGVPEAWLYERPADKVYKVHEGEEFNIGKVKGKVNRIGSNDIDVEIDGKSRTVGYGSSLKM